MARKKVAESLIVGIILLIIGLYNVLSSLGVLAVPVSYNWMVTIVLITVGVMGVIKSRQTSKLVGLLALVMGGIFLLELMGIIEWTEVWKVRDSLYLFLGLFIIY